MTFFPKHDHFDRARNVYAVGCMSESFRHSASIKSQRAAALGLVVNVSLAGVKLIAGILGHSYALVADAIESLADVVG